MNEIFLSYSRDDEAVAQKLNRRFKSFELGVWLDRDDIRGGHLWRRQIVDGIENCLLYVILLTENSIKSDNVRRELDLARMKHKCILPITMQLELENLSKDMQYQLVGLQQIDFADMFKRGARKLIYELTEFTPPHKTVFMHAAEERLSSRLEHASGDFIKLIKERYVIGRGSRVDVDLTAWDSNLYVSKQHAILFFSEGVWKIRRHDSAINPTFVNDQQISKEYDAILENGDEVVFADVPFRFVCEELED